MFVRRKVNPSGVVSVQVIAKQNGQSKLVKTMGSSSDELTIEELVQKGKAFIADFGGQQQLVFSDESSALKAAFEQISSHTQVGAELVLGKIFDDIGFGVIKNELFRQLVLARLMNPVSKLKTSDYLTNYQDIAHPVHHIYRYMDHLYATQKELIQTISYEHTKTILGGQIRVVFYDVTTLYFEVDDEDAFRVRGFSKEGKHQNPQVVLGLLVSSDGYPLAYDVFEGNTFEGHTMLPIVNAFKQKYDLGQLVIVADSGLLSQANIEALRAGDYEFILGARIKNEKKEIRDQILSLQLAHGQSAIVVKNGLNLIITYSDTRAKKDRKNREKGLKKIEKLVESGKLTKQSINNRGYNKYLKMQGKVHVAINYQRVEEDAAWDGLKGYVTNAKLSKEHIIEQYTQLWRIEQAFRIAKTDLKIRPIYHRLQRRIETHICISFVAYKVFKELERQLKEMNTTLSPEKTIEIAKTIYQVKANTPNGELNHIMLLTNEQKYVAQLFNFG